MCLYHVELILYVMPTFSTERWDEWKCSRWSELHLWDKQKMRKCHPTTGKYITIRSRRSVHLVPQSLLLIHNLNTRKSKKHSSTRNEMHANNTRLTFTVREGHFYCVNGYNCTYYHSYKKYVEQLEIISRTIKAQSVLRGIMALIQSLRSELEITSGIRQGRKLTPWSTDWLYLDDSMLLSHLLYEFVCEI